MCQFSMIPKLVFFYHLSLPNKVHDTIEIPVIDNLLSKPENSLGRTRYAHGSGKIIRLIGMAGLVSSDFSLLHSCPSQSWMLTKSGPL